VFGVTAARSSALAKLIARLIGLRGAYLLTGLRELVDNSGTAVVLGDAACDCAKTRELMETLKGPKPAQGDLAGRVGAVGADAVVGAGGAVAGGGLGPGLVDGGRGCLVQQGPVRAAGVVGDGEAIEQGLQVSQGGWAGWARSQFFRVCWNRSTFPCVWGWFGFPFFWVMPRRRSSASRALRPPRPPANRVVNTSPLSVKVEAGAPWAATAARNAARTAGR
jgi:hypothetical protein